MSAWMTSNAHILAVVEGAIRLGIIEQADSLKVARSLQRANVKSMNARYGETRESLRVTPIRWYTTPRQPLSDVSLLKQVNCLGYQSSEYDGYENGPAAKLLARIERQLASLGITRESPGYSEAPWGI